MGLVGGGVNCFWFLKVFHTIINLYGNNDNNKNKLRKLLLIVIYKIVIGWKDLNGGETFS